MSEARSGAAVRCAWSLATVIGFLSQLPFLGSCTRDQDHRVLREASGRPHVVVVVLDTVRRDRMSCYGYERETTPNLGTLLPGSRVYLNAYSTSSWTSPAHASLFTGLYPIAHRTTQENWTLGAERQTLAEVLSDRGYETLAIVMNPMLSAERGFDQGFASYVEGWKTAASDDAPGKQASPEGDDFAASILEERLRERRSAQPLFLFVNLVGPHSPYDSCGTFCAEFAPGPSDAITGNRWPLHYLKGVRLTAAQLRHLNDLYDAEIRQVDEVAGRIVASLKSHGLWENAFFAVTSDHGENIGDHGHMDHVFSLYETTTRIPLIIHYPALFEPGSEDGDVAQLPDLFATILGVAGVDASEVPSQGIDLSLAEARRERVAFMEYYRPVQALGKLLFRSPPVARRRIKPYDRRIRAVVADGQKLIWGSDGHHELYDLREDPREEVDRFDDPPYSLRRRALLELVERMVLRYQGDGGDAAPPSALDPQTREALERLGYVE